MYYYTDMRHHFFGVYIFSMFLLYNKRKWTHCKHAFLLFRSWLWKCSGNFLFFCMAASAAVLPDQSHFKNADRSQHLIHKGQRSWTTHLIHGHTPVQGTTAQQEPAHEAPKRHALICDICLVAKKRKCLHYVINTDKVVCKIDQVMCFYNYMHPS